MRAFDAPVRGEPKDGGAAPYWSPEEGRRRSPAAADGALRRGDGTEEKREGKEVQEDLLLTRKATVRSARLEKVEWR